MGSNYLLLVALLIAVFADPSMASPTCFLSTTRTATGSRLQCSCPGIHTTAVEIVASVNVEIPCMNNCILAAPDTQAACDSGNSATFRAAARAERKRCCSQCGGTFKAGRCNRIFLPSRPILDIGSGCASKVLETVPGQSFACKCAAGRNFQVDFFIASGVDDDCISKCARNPVNLFCSADTQVFLIREKYRTIFKDCCSNTCGGVAINGGFTCGFDTA